MPKQAIDFSKTIIYKIWKDDDFYIGSTTDYVSRKNQHKGNCSNKKIKKYNYKLYQTIRDKGGWDTWEMTPLEEYVDCKSKTQARIREEEWRIKLNADLNTYKAFGAETRQEYQKNYRQEHTEESKTYQKHYRQEHSSTIKARLAQKFNCECGGKYTYHGKSQHEKTLKHQKYLEKE